MRTVLVTGGLGYIGSHTVLKLVENNYNVIIYDNLSNSKIEVYHKIKNSNLELMIGDLLETEKLEKIFISNSIDFVIHFAALKSVSESNRYPLTYYTNNVNGSINLFNIMEKFGVRKIIFSSSATVYGDCECPVNEDNPTGKNISSVYGKTKFIIEEVLKDLNNWSVVILRYFNPIGCHSSGIIGEDPCNIPNNLFPYILKVASGELQELNIFGNDYPTIDGTCVRDYIHVEDLASAHVYAILKLYNTGKFIYNVGNGQGYTVKQILDTFESVNGIKLKHKFVARRDGDLAILYSDPSKIMRELCWKPEKTLSDMCIDGYNYIKNIYKEKGESKEQKQP
jgi:UDP-glucose 4-epimerase